MALEVLRIVAAAICDLEPEAAMEGGPAGASELGGAWMRRLGFVATGVRRREVRLAMCDLVPGAMRKTKCVVWINGAWGAGLH